MERVKSDPFGQQTVGKSDSESLFFAMDRALDILHENQHTMAYTLRLYNLKTVLLIFHNIGYKYVST
jgi:hypothetical protein